MSHNSRFKPGPTIAQCRDQGVTHLELQCLAVRCRHVGRLELGQVRTREDVPVNEIRWRCSACRGINVSVTAIRPNEISTPEPIFDTTDARPAPRRTPCAHRRKVLARS